ncbi:PDZ domain-containing protein [Methylacidimicrobium sp. AP8]|uniref:PDZ domain-containing protein n=1 Tax=Methylacidimicrobium sp. AP8 TaxID=2730359 RepID=UPI0019226865|nr:PDZ domain-containing protein [Methylacidimicrobium sp. AP8]
MPLRCRMQRWRMRRPEKRPCLPGGAVRRAAAAMAAFFLSGWWTVSSVPAQETAPLKTVPPLSAAFPLVQRGPEVRVRYPLAVNERTVVPPEARLHRLYARPKDARDSDGEDRTGKAPRRLPMPLGGIRLGGLPMGITAGMRGTGRNGNGKGGAGGTEAWTSAAAFREALDRLDGSDLRLVFSLPAAAPQHPGKAAERGSTPGKDRRKGRRRVRDEPLALPLGLLLAERRGAPTVLAVEAGSAGQQAGLRAQDRIVSLDGKPCPRKLSAFLALYRRERAAGRTELTLAVARAGNPAPVSLTVPLPPVSKGSLLDGPER